MRQRAHCTRAPRPARIRPVGGMDRLDARDRRLHDGGPRLRAAQGVGASRNGRRPTARSSRASPRSRSAGGRSFDDPVLDRADRVAYRNNYSLKIAGLRVLQARAQLGIAVGYLYPQVQQANGNVTYTSASRNAANTKAGDLEFWEYNAGVSVGWELDFWGKFRRSIEVCRRQPAGLRRRLRQRAGAARRAGRGHLRRHPVRGGPAEGRPRKCRPSAAQRPHHRGPVPRGRCRRTGRAAGAHPAAGDPGDDPAAGDRAGAGEERAQHAARPAPGRPRRDTGPAARHHSRRAASDCRRRPDRPAPAAPGYPPGGTRCRSAKRGGGCRRGRPLSELRVERLSRRGGRRRHEHHAHRQQRLRPTLQRERPRLRRRAVLQLEHPELRTHPQQRPGATMRGSSNCWRTTRARCSTR